MAKVVNYLSNKNLLIQFAISNQQGKMSDELAKMCMMLVERYAKKSNFSGYTYNDDMQAYALVNLVKYWNKFDVTRSDNPFAFLTQCVKMSFFQYLNKEKGQREIRDALLIDVGLNPSYNYTPIENQVENVRALDF